MSRIIKGTYAQGICTEIFVQTDGYINWYCVDGGTIVNGTYDEINEGVDVEKLHDIDTFTWDKPIDSKEEFEYAVNA